MRAMSRRKMRRRLVSVKLAGHRLEAEFHQLFAGIRQLGLNFTWLQVTQFLAFTGFMPALLHRDGQRSWS